MKGSPVLDEVESSDSYPNIKYKLAAHQRLLGDRYFEYVAVLDDSVASKEFFSALGSGQLALV